MTRNFSFVLGSIFLIVAAFNGCTSSTSPPSGNGAPLVIPATIDFGSLAVGQMRDTLVPIVNSGSDSVTITSDALSSAEARDTNFAHAVSLAPHGFENIHIQFVPATSGARTAMDSIHYQSAGKNYVAVMTLTANAGGTTGGGGNLVAAPNLINFGTLPVGQWHDTTVLLVNGGTAPVTITSNIVSGPDGKDTNFSQPVTIAPGSFQTIHIQFNPAQAGARSVTDLINYTSGGTNASVTITLQAQGSGTSGGGSTPGPGSTFTYDYSSVDTNGVTSAHTDSTYTIVRNTLTFGGKTNVVQVQGGNGGVSYYHLESNGDISVYIDLSTLPLPVNVSSNWFSIPIGSKTAQTSTLFDSTIQYPYNGSTIPVAVTIKSNALDLGASTITAAGHSFPSEKGSLAVTFSASAFGGFVTLASTVQTATIWFSKQLKYYPERQDQTVNSGVVQGNTTTSDTYLLKSYVPK